MGCPRDFNESIIVCKEVSVSNPSAVRDTPTVGITDSPEYVDVDAVVDVDVDVDVDDNDACNSH